MGTSIFYDLKVANLLTAKNFKLDEDLTVNGTLTADSRLVVKANEGGSYIQNRDKAPLVSSTVSSRNTSDFFPFFSFKTGSGNWSMGHVDEYCDLIYTSDSNYSSGTNSYSRFRFYNDGRLVGTFNGSLTGNATTATTLQTARTINGTSFNGSTNIVTSKWGTARNITIKDSSGTYSGTAVSVDGSGNATLKLPSEIKADKFRGSVIGSVAGNLTVGGELTISSARAKKKNIHLTNHTDALGEISKIAIVDYLYKNDKNKIPHIGFIADDTDSIFSTPSHNSMDLGNCVGMLLKAVQELNTKNHRLEKKNRVSREES